ncbi:hypothetical protein HRD78_13640 [Enterococcus faecalis]|nr:hypothetical protein [Enterococcus faecalis]
MKKIGKVKIFILSLFTLMAVLACTGNNSVNAAENSMTYSYDWINENTGARVFPSITKEFYLGDSPRYDHVGKENYTVDNDNSTCVQEENGNVYTWTYKQLMMMTNQPTIDKALDYMNSQWDQKHIVVTPDLFGIKMHLVTFLSPSK